MADTMEWTGRTVEAALEAAALAIALFMQRDQRAWSTRCSSSLPAASSA